MPLIEICNLKTHFFLAGRTVQALDGINLSIERGETLGLVGETGCGKSVTALSILRLIPQPPGKIIEGKVLFEGKDLLKLHPEAMRRVRGGKISMIFQEPMTSLNPVFPIGDQMAEVIRFHQGLGRREAMAKAVEMLELVHMPEAAKVARQYPHQLSGGMKQRAMIAMELSCNPSLLIADEPTTALDVTIQAQILRLLKEMKEKSGASILLITHDLGVVAQMADRVGVMYAGQIVEQAGVDELFDNPLHPYTQGLWGSIPRLEKDVEELQVIPGAVPDLSDPPSGCRFHPRCLEAMEICRVQRPPNYPGGGGHTVACFLYKT